MSKQRYVIMWRDPETNEPKVWRAVWIERYNYIEIREALDNGKKGITILHGEQAAESAYIYRS